MDVAAVFFARPRAERRPLTMAPCVESSMPADHPDQLRLSRFLGHAEHMARPQLARVSGPVAVALDLRPLAGALQAGTGRQFASAWATKSVGEHSYLTVAPAIEVVDPSAPMEFEVTTSAPSETPTYRKQIRDQLARALTLPDGPVALELAFVVGPGRDWVELWRPTIASLDPLLGAAVRGTPWHPRDGRIVELGLHCLVDPDHDDRVHITIAPRMLSSAG